MADRILKRLIRTRFIITLVTGETFDGLLIEVDERTIRLANVEAVGKNSRIGIDGDLYIPRSDVVYLQKPR